MAQSSTKGLDFEVCSEPLLTDRRRIGRKTMKKKYSFNEDRIIKKSHEFCLWFAFFLIFSAVEKTFVRLKK